MVTVWKNNDTVILYYDGVPFKGTGEYAQSNSYINIGGASDSTQASAQYFLGDLSDPRVYSEALTESQIKQIFKWGQKYLGI